MRYLHTTIHVSDLEKSVEFYESMAGLTVVNRFAMGPQEFVFLANGQGETQIELIGEESAHRVRQGISIGFEADNLERTYQAAKDRGLTPTEVFAPNPHVRFFFVEDPDGMTVQFSQSNG